MILKPETKSLNGRMWSLLTELCEHVWKVENPTDREERYQRFERGVNRLREMGYDVKEFEHCMQNYQIVKQRGEK